MVTRSVSSSARPVSKKAPQPSPEASAALVLVEVLRDQIMVLQNELIGARRLATAAFGVATAAIGGLITVAVAL